MKKRYAIAVSIALFLSILVSAISVEAATPRIAYGKLYINGVLAPNDIPVKLAVPSQSNPFTKNTYANGNYVINFIADDWEECTFSIYMRNAWHNPTLLILDVEKDIAHAVNLNLVLPNSPPNTPSNPNPADGATIVATNNDLSWICTDPDGDSLKYDVYFGTTNPPTIQSTGQTSTTHDTGTMAVDTKYYWMITAKDFFGASTSSPVWSFTTGTTGGSTGGGGTTGGGTTTSGGGVLTADAGGPYFGAPNSAINFDGTGSNDTDGTIVQYDWKFFTDDTWRNNLGSTPTYTYTEPGTYQVTLRITDDDGNTDEDIATATIIGGNNQPTKPVVIGNQTGNKNIEYTYTAVSVDPDGDTIKYTFDWDDDTATTTDYIPNATAAVTNHSWAYGGVYNIWVQAKDYNNATSEKTYLTILIDTIKVGDIGYLIDLYGDGIYDEFESAEGEHLITNTTKQTDGTYLIDSDGDNDWDWIYDPTTDTLTAYTASEGASSQVTKADNTLWYALTIGTILAIILIAIIYLATRMKQKPKKK